MLLWDWRWGIEKLLKIKEFVVWDFVIGRLNCIYDRLYNRRPVVVCARTVADSNYPEGGNMTEIYLH